MVLALRYYGRQMARLRRFTVPAMLLPALGNTCIFYIAPLIVAHLAGPGLAGIGAAMPYVAGFAGVLLLAEVVWRVGIHCLNRLDGRGIENLYAIGMDELLARDAAFFHDNFAGSLTKRVLSFASRFEDFTDNLVFNIVGSLVPLAFASVVLWRYDPLLVAGLIGLIAVTGAGTAPLIRRRQKLVDQREEAIARVSGRDRRGDPPGGAGRPRDRVRRCPAGRVRHDGRRARREAVRRAAAASRAGPGDPA